MTLEFMLCLFYRDLFARDVCFFVFTEEFVGTADETVTKAKDDLDRDILENGNLFWLNFV